MPTTYNYTNVTDLQAVEKSKQGVDDSEMTDKSLEYGIFDEDARTLDLTFTNALSAPDKAILDGIVAALPDLDPQDPPPAPTNLVLTEVSDTVEVEFDKVAASGDVDWYEVWSSVGGTTDYNLIGIVPEADAGTPTKVVDVTYAKKATIYYKIYAVRHGVYSSALSDNIALANNASDVTGLTIVAQLDTFILDYVLPTERKFSYVQIKRHAHADQGSLSEGSATQVYAGIANHFVYTIPDADLTKWHQFWVYTVTAT